MKITLTNIIQIEEPTQEILDYCKKELTFNNPDYTKKQSMGFWVGRTPKTIKLYDYYNDNIYLPIGCFEDIWKLHPYKEDYKDYSISKKANIKSNIVLRNYQEPCANALKKYVNGVFVLPPGLGKTQIGLHCASVLGQKTLWLTHTKELLQQAKERCENNLECSTSTITEGKCNTSGDIVFATVQTLVSLVDKEKIKQDEFGLVIVDECFPRGTLINTPNGYVNIEDINIGDDVYSYNHVTKNVEIKKVDYLFSKESTNLMEIKISNNKKLICTKNHPIYTDRGYVKAVNLKKGDIVYELCLLWERNNKRTLFKRKMVNNDEKTEKNKQNLLFTKLWNKLGSQKFNKIYTIRSISKKNDDQQPYDEKRGSGKSVNDVERKEPQTENKRWEWYRNDKTTRNSIQRIEKTQFIYNPRTTNKNTSKKWKWLSNLLQSRPWFGRIKNWYRNRWKFTQSYRTSKSRYEERYVLREFRVENIKVQKQRSFRKFKQCCGKNYVYNIGVADNHNYFVNDILVHNCHHLSTNAETVKMFEKCVNYFSARYKLGITATLHRADGLENTTTKILGNVIYEVKKSDDKKKLIGIYENKQIIELPIEQFQVPAQIYMLKTTYNVLDRDVFDRNSKIVFARLISDLCGDYDRNKQVLNIIKSLKGYSIVISERIDQLHYLSDNTPNSICIDGKTNKKLREKLIEEFRQGKYKVLFASYSLVAEGLDVPMLENLVMASPVKDQRLVVQAIGRVQRPYKDKKIANVYDLIDDVSLLDKFTRARKKVYKNEGWEMR